MHYIIQDDFVDAYHKGRFKSLLKAEDVTKEQFYADQKTLHAILSATYYEYALTKKVLQKYAQKADKKADGIAAYKEIRDRFEYHGVKYEAEVEVLRRTFTTPYQNGYRGGLAEYINQLMVVAADLDQYRAADNGSEMTDKEKCSQVVANLLSEPSIRHIHSSACLLHKQPHMTFLDLCQQIGAIAYAEEQSTPRITRRMNTLQTFGTELDDDDFLEQSIRAMLMKKQNKSDLSVPSMLWRNLDDAAKQSIYEARDKVKAELNRSSTGDTRKANLATLAEVEEDDASDREDYEDEGIDQQTMQLMDVLADKMVFRMSQGEQKVARSNARVVKTVHCDYGRIQRFAMNMRNFKHGTMTSDDGADTTIVGSAFRRVATNAGQFANVYGFDTNHAKKEYLPIGTADTIVRGFDIKQPDSSFEFIARFHQCVLNEDSNISLASEAQMRNNGLVVDSVSQGSCPRH